MATHVYVDGFNLYYGVLKDNPRWKWLDIAKLMKLCRPDEEISKIRYFTAEVHPDRVRSEERDRQKRYTKALGSCQNLEVIWGKYQSRGVTCRGRCGEPYDVPEEKQTDVKIAVAMMTDAIDVQPDKMVLISGDSDLEPAVEWIRKRYGKIKIYVYVPQLPTNKHQRRNDAYKKMGVDARDLPLDRVPLSQFPRVVDLGSGRKVEKPQRWI